MGLTCSHAYMSFINSLCPRCYPGVSGDDQTRIKTKQARRNKVKQKAVRVTAFGHKSRGGQELRVEIDCESRAPDNRLNSLLSRSFRRAFRRAFRRPSRNQSGTVHAWGGTLSVTFWNYATEVGKPWPIRLCCAIKPVHIASFAYETHIMRSILWNSGALHQSKASGEETSNCSRNAPLGYLSRQSHPI